MEDLLQIQERVQFAIRNGESHYREFKSAFQGEEGKKVPRQLKELCRDIAKTLTAFGNADGGELFVGIEDNGEISGLSYNKKQIDYLVFKSYKEYIHKDTPLTLRKAVVVDFEEKKTAYFSVAKGRKYIYQTSEGKCFQRIDTDSMPTSFRSIHFEQLEANSIAYDNRFFELAKISDLEHNLVKNVANSILDIPKIEKLLQYLELAEFNGENLVLRNAALLLFAKKIRRWHPHCEIRVFKVKGTIEGTGKNFNVEELAGIEGNIFTLLEEGWGKIKSYLLETKFSKDATFRKRVIYPEAACQEAIYNAIIHRDYNIAGRGIEVKIFDDRLEVISPGNLLSTLKIEDLGKGAHQSRNSYVGKILRESGYIRKKGEGIQRMFEQMENSDLQPPKFASFNSTFVVTLFNKQVYSEAEKEWLEEFTELELNKKQQAIVRLGLDSRPLSTKEIREFAKIVDTHKFNKLIQGLDRLGVLERLMIQSDAHSFAKKQKINKNEVKRFKIVPPKITKLGKEKRVKSQVEKAMI